MHPRPFCIYSGMLEDVYTINNYAGLSTLFTPGMARQVRAVLEHISENPLIIDDLFGMFAPVKNSKHVVWTRTWIDKLESLRRITWPCQHKEQPPALGSADLVAFLPPVANMLNDRLEIANPQTVDNFPKKWFVIPSGDPENCQRVAQFWADALPRRDVYLFFVPAATIDSCWVFIAPEGKLLQTVPYPEHFQLIRSQEVHAPVTQERQVSLYEGIAH